MVRHVRPPVVGQPTPTLRGLLEEIQARLVDRFGEELTQAAINGEGEVAGLYNEMVSSRRNNSRIFSYIYGGSASGRMSSRGPDMQRIPRSTDLNHRPGEVPNYHVPLGLFARPEGTIQQESREVPNYNVQSWNAERLTRTLADPLSLDIETVFPESARRRARALENDMADTMSMATQAFAEFGSVAVEASLVMDDLNAAIRRIRSPQREARISPADFMAIQLADSMRPDGAPRNDPFSIPVRVDPNIPAGRVYIIDPAALTDFAQLEHRVIAWDLGTEQPSTPIDPDATFDIIDYKPSPPEEPPAYADTVTIKKAIHEVVADKRPFHQRLNAAPRSARRSKRKGKR